MKKTHQRAEALVRQAIRACGEDFALSEVRSHLHRALTSLDSVGKKRVKRNEYAEKFRVEGEKANEKWLKQIAENAKKAAELQKVEQDVRDQKPQQS